MRYARRTLRPALLAGCAALAACGGDGTQLIVVVDSDLAVPSELTAVRAIAVDVAGNPASQAELALADRGLPLSFGVLPAAGGPDVPVTIEVAGIAPGGQVAVRRTARVTFVRGKRLLLRMFLARACQSRTCPAGDTCTELGCKSPVVDPDTLPVISPGEELKHDAGHAPPPDGGAPDAPALSLPDTLAPDTESLDAPPPPDTPGNDDTSTRDGGPGADDGGPGIADAPPPDGGNGAPDATQAADAAPGAPDATPTPDAGGGATDAAPRPDAASPPDGGPGASDAAGGANDGGPGTTDGAIMGDAGPRADATRSAPDGGPGNADATGPVPDGGNPPDAGNASDAGNATDSGVAGCAVTLVPDNPVFGGVEVGRSLRAPVAVRNTGTRSCRVENVALSGSGAFTLEALATDPVVLVPGAEVRLWLTFAPPSAGPFVAGLTMDTDDPSRPAITVNPTGAGAPAPLRVLPHTVDLGAVPRAGSACRAAPWRVKLWNLSTAGVLITSVEIRGSPEFSLAMQPTPTLIAPGADAAFTIAYTPFDEGTDNALAVITHSASPFPLVVPLTAEARTQPALVETFDRAPPLQMDVLIVVSNASSMLPNQQELAQRADAFVRTPNADFHVGITGADVANGGLQGRLNAPPPYSVAVITPLSQDAPAVFETNAMAGAYQTGSSPDTAFEAAFLALTSPNLTGANAGFARDSADLALLFVSDRDDGSPRAAELYRELFSDLRPTGRVSIHAVAGPPPLGCLSGTGATPAPRFAAAVEAFGGTFGSVCVPGRSLTNAANAIYGPRNTFPLAGFPQLSTMVVVADGNVLPERDPVSMQPNWTFDGAHRALRVHVAPAMVSNGTVQVSYTLECQP